MLFLNLQGVSTLPYDQSGALRYRMRQYSRSALVPRCPVRTYSVVSCHRLVVSSQGNQYTLPYVTCLTRFNIVIEKVPGYFRGCRVVPLCPSAENAVMKMQYNFLF